MTFKHQGYQVGEFIRAYDFKPMSDREDLFVEGEIVRSDLGTREVPFAHYVIRVTKDTAYPEEPREEVYVPMEVSFLEYDNRVEKI